MANNQPDAYQPEVRPGLNTIDWDFGENHPELYNEIIEALDKGTVLVVDDLDDVPDDAPDGTLVKQKSSDEDEIHPIVEVVGDELEPVGISETEINEMIENESGDLDTVYVQTMAAAESEDYDPGTIVFVEEENEMFFEDGT